MRNTVYTFVEQTQGWAYRREGAFSQLFSSLDEAREAARRAEKEDGGYESIMFEDRFGRWCEPLCDGFAQLVAAETGLEAAAS